MICLNFIYSVMLFVEFSNADWDIRLVADTFDTKPNTSMVVAILPLKLSLCKLASIAEGKTKEQLMKALNYQKNTKVNFCYTSVFGMLESIKLTDLVLINKLYVNYSSEVNTTFLANASSSYGVQAEFVGFNMPVTAFAFINNEIATATFWRIRNIVEYSDLTDQTKMMMITAAHLRSPCYKNCSISILLQYKYGVNVCDTSQQNTIPTSDKEATWEIPFDIKETQYRKFYHLNNNVSEIPMMSRDDYYNVFENMNYKVLTTKLKRAAITLLVPTHSNGLPALLRELKWNPNLINEARAAMTIQARILVMPRLKIKSYLDLTESLTKSTVNEILNSHSSDLDGILKAEFKNSSHMFVSKIKQKLFVEVDELGLSRHDIKPQDQSGGPRKTPVRLREFAADQPFYFTIDLQEFIPSEESLSIVHHVLFAGVYYGPE